MFCVTTPTAATAIPHILVSSCPDSTGHQPGPRSFVERQGLRTAKGGSRKWEANAPPWSEPWGLFCGDCSVCSGPCELREPAHGGRVRRFHSDGDRFNGRKGTTVDSLIDFSLDLMQDPPGAEEGQSPDRQANIEAALQCGHGAVGLVGTTAQPVPTPLPMALPVGLHKVGRRGRCGGGSSCLPSLVLDPSPHASSRREPKSHSWGVKCTPGEPALPAPEPFIGSELPHICHLSFPPPNSPAPSPSCPSRQSHNVNNSYSFCLYQPLLTQSC